MKIDYEREKLEPFAALIHTHVIKCKFGMNYIYYIQTYYYI